MISKQELKVLMVQLESESVEKTISTSDTEKFGEAICSFSNDYAGNGKPGYLLIGVQDNGDLAGLKVDDRLLQTLMDFRNSGRILPPPLIQVTKFEFDLGDVAVVEVLPSRQPPVRWKGKVCIRIGPRKTVANETEERRLSERRSAFARSFDLLPCSGSKIDDLGLDIFRTTYLPSAIDRETLESNHREIKQQLASLRFFDLDSEEPTNAGILMFGINPRYFLQGGYVQFVRFEGVDEISNVVFEKRFEGDLVTQMRVINDFIEGQIVKSVQYALGLEYEFNYPKEAIQELIFNAIIHRDYQSNAPIRFYEFANRIEITNPGGLFGDARPENFPNTNDYRNPVIAEAAKVLGWVNKFNVGVKRAIAALLRNGNPSPEFIKDELSTFGVVIYSKV
jgi:ATP-dependent DNA helicase RecG